MKTERVVLDLQAHDSLLLIRESKIKEEVVGYQEWFDENAVDVPADMTKRIDRALAELADAEAALFCHIEGQSQDSGRPILAMSVIKHLKHLKHLRRADGD